MKKPLVLSTTLLMAVACSERQPQPATTTAASEPDATVAQVAECPPASGYTYLPQDVVFTFKHHVRTDRFVQNRQGGTYRRVIVELLEGDATSTADKAKQSMTEAGFRFLDARPVPNDGTRMRFKKPGEPVTVITAYPATGDDPAAPGAIGTLVIEFSSHEPSDDTSQG